MTINELFEVWKQLKRGLKDNTFQNYQFMYRQYVAPRFGKQKISTLVKSDVKRFYNTLADERGLSISTIDCVHTVLHQVLDMAVDDCYIRRNPSDNVLKELKQTIALKSEKRRALTKKEQDLFLDYLRNSPKYQHWYPIFAVMIGTGLGTAKTTFSHAPILHQSCTKNGANPLRDKHLRIFHSQTSGKQGAKNG